MREEDREDDGEGREDEDGKDEVRDERVAAEEETEVTAWCEL